MGRGGREGCDDRGTGSQRTGGAAAAKARPGEGRWAEVSNQMRFVLIISYTKLIL